MFKLDTSPDARDRKGPFDIIGDVHGCVEELQHLLACLGTRVELVGDGPARYVEILSTGQRPIVFLGDLVDRGPATPDVLRIVMTLNRTGKALAVAGNHDVRFLRYLQGKTVPLTHGLELTAEQMLKEGNPFREEVRSFFENLPFHLWLDDGALAVAHAGIKEEMLGSTTKETRKFCLYGETSGEQDEFGLPVRYHWAADYRGRTAIIYGHTPVLEPSWVNETLCIDTGCCFGGALTAVQWPEREIVSVPAKSMYAQKRRPFGHPPCRPSPQFLKA